MATPNVTDWASLAVAAAGFLYAGLQLRASQRAARGSFLLEIHEALRHHDSVHRRLDQEDGFDWSPKAEGKMADLEAYMGVFERIQILVEQGSLDLETVDRLYSFRIVNVTRNGHIFDEKFETKAVFWSDFQRLWRNLEACPYWQRNVEFLQINHLPVPRKAPQIPGDEDRRRLHTRLRQIAARLVS